MTLRPHRATSSALLVLSLLVSSLPLSAQVADQPTPARTNPLAGRRPQAIQEPTEPDKVRGTYTLAGELKTVTEGAFYATYQIIKPHEEKPQRPLQPQQVLEHILLFAEASSMGFGLSAEEKDLINPLKTNQAFAGAIKQRLTAWKITEDQYVQYLAEKQAIQRLKDWYANSVRIRSSEVYDLWKRDNFLYRLAYLEFSADGGEAELRKTQPTTEQLQAFYKTNPQIQNERRVPTSVTADLLVFDPTSISAEELEKIRGSKTISREDSLTYFVANRARLVKQIRSEDRPKIYPPPGEDPRPVDQLVTPFMLLREQIGRELVLGDRIAKAFAAAENAKNSADLATIAKTNGLNHVRLDKASRQKVLNDHSNLGPALFTDLFNAAAGSRSPKIQFNGPLQYFWRLEDKAVSSLPPFEAVKETLIDPWYEFTAYQNAQNAAGEFLKKVEAAVVAETADQEAAIEARHLAEAEAEIKRHNYTGQRATAERQKARNFAQNEKRTLRSEATPKHFDAVVKAEGLTLKTHGPFSFTFGRHDRSRITDVDKNRLTYLESSFQIKALGLDHVSPILSDIVTRTHFIVKITAKDEPPFERMSAVDYHQRRMAAERQATFTTNYMWTGFQAQNRLGWKGK